MLNIFKKDFLLGVGLGFLISALLVSFFGSEDLSDREIKARAARLGMIQAETEERKAQVGQPKTVAEEPLAEEPLAEEPLAEEPLDEAEEPQTEPEEPQTEKPHNMVEFVIKPGMGSETISRLLEGKGVIKDRDEFYQLVTEKNAHRRFRTGTFELPVEGDPEEILKTLTGK